MADFASLEPTGISNQQGLQQIALNKIVMQRDQAQTQDYQAQTQQRLQEVASTKMKNDNQQKLQEDMQRIAANKQATNATEWANQLFATGHPVEAASVAHVAAQTNNQLAQAEWHKAQQGISQAKEYAQVASNIGREAAMIPPGDTAGFNGLLDKIEKASPEMKSWTDRFRGKEYTPEARQAVIDFGMKVETQLKEKQRTLNDEAKRMLEDKQGQAAAARARESDARAEALATGQTAHTKNAGSGSKAGKPASHAEVGLIMDELQIAYPDTNTDSPQAKLIASDIAKEAATILDTAVRQGVPMTPAQARAAAIHNAGPADKGGDGRIGTVLQPGGWFGKDKEKTQYSPSAKTAAPAASAAPSPAPAKQVSAAAQKAMDSDRITILQQELAKAQQTTASATDPTSKARAQGDVDALQREIGKAGGKAPPTASEFNSKWTTLKSGETLTGPDGKTYTKK
jgi:hypothetical protein